MIYAPAPRLLFLVVVTLVATRSELRASQKVHWSWVCERSRIVVVGTLSQLKPDVLAYPEPGANRDGSRYWRMFWLGEIEVETVLKGESDDRIAITWVGDTKLVPNPLGLIHVGGDRHFDEGARGIWMIFDKRYDFVSGALSDHHAFTFVPADSLERVKTVIDQQAE